MIDIAHDVPLAAHTTLELGGPARWFVTATDDGTIARALRWARTRGLSAWILGGGSNVVVADAGLPGLVVAIATRGIQFIDNRDHVDVLAQAGEPWDPLVERTIVSDLAGLECLSGIPGLVGATPIQNVGAYGQEIASVLGSVRVLDRDRDEVVELSRDACELSYRDSRFKREPDRFVVLAVRLRLRKGGAPTLRYEELAGTLAGTPAPSLAQVRDAVLALRRRKSMVIDPSDPNRRSVGSFFTNPVVDPSVADAVAANAVREGFIASADAMPRWPAPGGIKLSAGWLVEASGLPKGHGAGPIGLSDRHALAIVHRGGGTTTQLVTFARMISDRVAQRFGVRLVPEPVFLGMPRLNEG